MLSTQEIRRGRFKSYFKSLISSESPVQAALENLQKLTTGETRQVLADTYGGVSRIDTKTDQVQSIVTQVSQDVQELKTEYRVRASAANQDALRELLEPSPFPEDYFTSFDRSRVQGTGDWIVQDSAWKSWLHGETPYMWMSGGPGTGKSFLATKLISWANDNLPHVAYFYFRSNDPETRSILQALRDASYQLTESDAFYAKQLARNIHTPDDIKTIPSAFRKLFVEAFDNDTRGEPFRIILDGLDEAEPEEFEELLDQLAGYAQDPPSRRKAGVQICLIGRSHLSDLVSSYLDLPAGTSSLTLVHVTPDRVADDVKAYIEDGVAHSRVMSSISPELKAQVIETMEKRVDGLFILAKFMLANANRQRRPNSILASLQSFPQEINGMLSLMLADLSSTITEEEAGDLNEVLGWVACAQQALTIEQLEAILILRFEAPPFRFEDSLRGQYASFFSVEREDGLTTDDLVRAYERRQRSGRRRSLTPTDHFRRSISARDTSPSSEEFVKIARRSTTPVGSLQSDRAHHLSPPRSPIRLPDVAAPDQDMEFKSKKSSTTVTFFHASVRDFFRNGKPVKSHGKKDGPSIGFGMLPMQTHILKSCLRIFNDKKWFQSQDLGGREYSIKQYAAWYWQEHLAAINPKEVSKDDKSIIGQQVYNMIADEDTIADWTLLYEQGDEGLEVLSDSNIAGLQAWMRDEDVVESLDPEAKKWVQESAKQPNSMFHALGRFYAKAWLDESFKHYVPTKICFKIVQGIAYLDAGHKWSDSQHNWGGISFQERMEKAMGWAQYPKTAHWYRRVGSTYLAFNMHKEALQHYNEGLKLGKDSVEVSGPKAFCLFKDGSYAESLELALKCEAMEHELVSKGGLSESELAASRWRLYKHHYLVASSYSRQGYVDKAVEYFHKALESSGTAGLRYDERFEPVSSILEELSEQNRHSEMIKVIKELSLQAAGPHKARSRLVDFLLSEHGSSLVLEAIPKAACREGEVEFLLERLQMALEIAHEKRDALKALFLRIAVGTTLAYGREIEPAMEVFERISLIEYQPRGNVPTRQAHAISFQKLASLYKDQALQAGVENHGADRWIEKLEAVQTKHSSHKHDSNLPLRLTGSDFNSAAVYLALFYRLRGRAKDAEALLAALIAESCEILEDEDLGNDEFPLENLLKLFIAAGKSEDVNAKALAVSMRQLSPNASGALGYNNDSPLQSRVGERPEPKLPDIQSMDRSCAQCLMVIEATAPFYICRYCLDSFCDGCINQRIRSRGSTDVPVVVEPLGLACSADHAWLEVPPLDKILHRGEMLVDGQVCRFVEWEEGVKKRWRR